MSEEKRARRRRDIARVKSRTRFHLLNVEFYNLRDGSLADYKREYVTAKAIGRLAKPGIVCRFECCNRKRASIGPAVSELRRLDTGTPVRWKSRMMAYSYPDVACMNDAPPQSGNAIEY